MGNAEVMATAAAIVIQVLARVVVVVAVTDGGGRYRGEGSYTGDGKTTTNRPKGQVYQCEDGAALEYTV